jgi:hypothetical protein
MADIEFDKSKPYGEVFGPIKGAPKARFSQNGLYFNASGVKVGGTFKQDPRPTLRLGKPNAPQTKVIGRQNRMAPSADSSLTENRRALAVEEQAE